MSKEQHSEAVYAMKKIWRLWLLLPLLLCLASCAKQQETAGLLWIKNFSGTEGVYDYGLTAMDEAFVLQTVAGPASIHPRTSESTTACPLPDGSYRLLGGDRLYVLDAQETVHTMELGADSAALQPLGHIVIPDQAGYLSKGVVSGT